MKPRNKPARALAEQRPKAGAHRLRLDDDTPQPCPACLGWGEIEDVECSRCDGTGEV